MNLSEIAKNSFVIIDTNILNYAIEEVSYECTELLKCCAKSDIFGIIPSNILAEFIHVRMITEARELGLINGSNPARKLSENPAIVCQLKRYPTEIKNLLGIGLKIEPILVSDYLVSLQIQQKFGLLTNDSLIVSIAERLRINKIATADKAFNFLTEFEIYAPNDISSK
jgi:predicted nucleic acid-binding protein